MNTTSTARKTLITVGGIFVALLFYPVVAHVVFYYQKSTLATMIYHYLFMCLGVLVLYFYSLKVEGNSLVIWHEKQYKVLFYILSIVVLFLLQLPGNLIAKIPKWIGWHEALDTLYLDRIIKSMISWYHLSLTILVLCTVAWSISVELVFRGYLLPRLSSLLKSKVAAIIISSILFAYFPYGSSLKRLISEFCSGIFFAFYYQKFRNIKVLIASRILIDLATMLVLRNIYNR